MAKASEAERQRWLEEISAWRQSGETLSGWARHRGYSRDALQYWKERLAGEAAGPAVSPAIRLMPVIPAAASHQALELRIERDGFRVVLPADFDAAALSRLLDVVGSRC